MRYEAIKNRRGPGIHIIDHTTGREIAWVYDQEYGHNHPEEDERRARLFADALNGKINLQEDTCTP